MENLRKRRTWETVELRKWEAREIQDLGIRGPGEMEGPGNWRIPKKLRNVYYVLLTLFFLLQLFGDSWISRVVAGALTVFSTAPITRYLYL
jgi:hypothetical protein